jgi:hypothetical protein
LKNELKAIVGEEAYDEFLENYFVKILLIPYETKSVKMKMNDSLIIDKLSEWLDDDKSVAAILLNELIMYLKSGLAYKHFISAAIYK